MNADTTIALFSALFVLAVVPGPSDLAVVARAVSAGFRQAVWMVAGIVIADALLIMVAITSVAALDGWIQGLTTWLKLLGGLFLVGLGLVSLRAEPTAHPATTDNTPARGASSILSGFLMTLADPKAVLFYMALLPAFTDLSQLGSRDVLLILLAATLAICSVKLSYAWLAGRASGMIQSRGFQRTMNRLGAALLLGIGSILLLQAWRTL